MTTSAYIHIPFCEHICTYCDFTKNFYNEDIAKKYLDALEIEIKEKYKHEELKTLYIGGGTPTALSYDNLKRLLDITKIFQFDKEYEFTVEVNPENITKEKLFLLKKYGVNRISIGVESTTFQFLNYLGRHHDFSLVQEKISLIKEVGISNINVDLIYAIPNETLEDLLKDLENLVSLDVKHISTYSLEIHKNTILGIKKEKSISDEVDYKMYSLISNYLQEKGFIHYEVSNFAKDGYFSCHNLVYWHNDEYYGFGLGASGYLNNIRYTNTKNIGCYIDKKWVFYEEELSLKDKISYELILGFRLLGGINKKKFYQKYHKNLIDEFNIKDLIQKGDLIVDGDFLKINPDKIYVQNSILENFIE